MRFAAMLILMTATWTACGGSQDVCQRFESLLQSEANKVQSCGGDNSSILKTLTTTQASCETDLKNCTPSDVSALNSYVTCQESADTTVQCDWFTEADATDDPTFQTYENASTDCENKIAGVSAACTGGD